MNIKETSKHFITILAKQDREKNQFRISMGEERNIFFWLAEPIASELGLDNYDVDKVIDFLSQNDMAHWRHKSLRTIHLTDKGYKWEYYKSIFEDQQMAQNVTNKITNITNSPKAVIVFDSENVSVNIDSDSKIYPLFQDFLNKVNQDSSIKDETKKELKEHLEQFDQDYKENKKPNKWQWSSFFDSAKNIASVAEIAIKIGQSLGV